MTKEIRNQIINIFNTELENWNVEEFINAGANDKEDIAREAIKQFPEYETEIYDLFWTWVDSQAL